jgi:hypothetical protein
MSSSSQIFIVVEYDVGASLHLNTGPLVSMSVAHSRKGEALPSHFFIENLRRD